MRRADAIHRALTPRTILAAYLHLLFPTPCHVCRRPLDPQRVSDLCGRCWEQLERMPLEGCTRCGWPFPTTATSLGAESPICQRCRETPDRFQIARAALIYREDGIARAAILLAKHGRRHGLLTQLARVLAEAAPQLLALGDWDGLVPVPLHWMRRWQRGFNQAEVLARAVGRRYGIPVRGRVLRRVRATARQHGDFTARRRNVEGAFAARGSVAGHRLLVVDDVFTTGATVDACAAALLRAGAMRVGVLTLARVE